LFIVAIKHAGTRQSAASAINQRKYNEDDTRSGMLRRVYIGLHYLIIWIIHLLYIYPSLVSTVISSTLTR